MRLVAFLLAIFLAGCIGGTSPILYVDNATDDPAVVDLRIVDGAKVAFAKTYDLGPHTSVEEKIRLKGEYTVHATAGDLTEAAPMEFWWGGFLGGQMYAWVTVDDDAIHIAEAHAD